ncbi:hypothetical protein PR048_033239 [Dryococelus australis]|uniref:Uncharacterized protein n=1 Tax=Dryococelus australis TaxID=614101 RepID=A0ABQ9FZP9_9NEOP|nr:hypothetical protein PR048_033239 [Dryococelus australis]
MRKIEVNMKRRRNESSGETAEPRENPPTNGIVRHDFQLRKSGLAMRARPSCQFLAAKYFHQGDSLTVPQVMWMLSQALEQLRLQQPERPFERNASVISCGVFFAFIPDHVTLRRKAVTHCHRAGMLFRGGVTGRVRSPQGFDTGNHQDSETPQDDKFMSRNLRWLDNSLLTLANWVQFFAWVIVPNDASLWLGDFLGDLPFTPPLHSGSAPYSPRFALIRSQDLEVAAVQAHSQVWDDLEQHRIQKKEVNCNDIRRLGGRCLEIGAVNTNQRILYCVKRITSSAVVCGELLQVLTRVLPVAVLMRNHGIVVERTKTGRLLKEDKLDLLDGVLKKWQEAWRTAEKTQAIGPQDSVKCTRAMSTLSSTTVDQIGPVLGSLVISIQEVGLVVAVLKLRMQYENWRDPHSEKARCRVSALLNGPTMYQGRFTKWDIGLTRTQAIGPQDSVKCTRAMSTLSSTTVDQIGPVLGSLVILIQEVGLVVAVLKLRMQYENWRDPHSEKARCSERNTTQLWSGHIYGWAIELPVAFCEFKWVDTNIDVNKCVRRREELCHVPLQPEADTGSRDEVCQNATRAPVRIIAVTKTIHRLRHLEMEELVCNEKELQKLMVKPKFLDQTISEEILTLSIYNMETYFSISGFTWVFAGLDLSKTPMYIFR